MTNPLLGYFLNVTLEAALSELAPRVLRYCVGYMGDRGLGEEIAQESLAALVRAWRTSGMPRNPDAFVFAIAKRRARRTLLRRSLLLPLERLWNHRQHGMDPEEGKRRMLDTLCVTSILLSEIGGLIFLWSCSMAVV